MRWILGAIILLIAGIALQLGLLVYAMYVLLGVMFVSRYLAYRWISEITVDRQCSGTTGEIGTRIGVIVDVRNSGTLPIPWLLIEDSVPKLGLTQRPPRFTLDGRRSNIVQLGSRGQKLILYQVTFLMRGYYQLGPCLLETGDLFGLHRRFRVASKPHYVLIYPKVIPLQGYDLTSRRPIGEVRMTHRLFEDPTRICGLREYQNGDSLNRIHWRATARTGTLHCKTYEPSCIVGMTILLDFHQSGYPDRNEPVRSELLATAAASLANAVYQMGQQIGFITNGRDAADRIREEGVQHDFRTRSLALETVEMIGRSERLRPVIVETRRGTEQLMRILEALARAELTDGLKFPDLTIEAGSRLPRDATIVALLPTASPETAIALGNLRRRGYAVTAVLAMFEDEPYAECMGRLMAEGVDVRRIDSEPGISNLCSAQLVR
jgi:uncharacterized protein (DUF58 family)